MKAAIVTDTHFGVRGNSKYFMDRQREFFDNVFFPYIDENEIKVIFHLGDIFDKRQMVNFVMLDEAKDFFFKEVEKRNLEIHYIIGNHDCPFRNTNFPNGVRLLLHWQKNVHIYEGPTEIEFDGTKICIIPWVNSENSDETKRVIESSNAKYMMGHLEIQGFQMQRGIKAESGFERKYLSRFQRVFSGHFHHRSNEDNVWYLGNPYETTWSDWGNKKGFHILDFQTDELEFIENPYTSHVFIDSLEDITQENVTEKIVKVDLTNFTDEEVEKAYTRIDSFSVKAENLLFLSKTDFKTQATANTEDLAVMSTKDIMTEYVESMESEDKKYDELKTILVDLYDRALEIQ